MINLAGRSVSCRYTAENLRAMMDSRVDSARVVGEAVAAAARPPRVWLQMSTATIYAHRFDAAHDETTGVIGGSEAGVPDYWAHSVEIAKNWERAQTEAPTPATRKVGRAAWGVPLGLPATRWMAELGAFALRSDTELLLKSRRVAPGRLRAAGFAFAYSEWERAAASLVQRARLLRAASRRARESSSHAV